MKQGKEIELLHKPNQVLMISNKEITLNQRKVYNVILYQARKELLDGNNQSYFSFSISELKEKAGIKATDNWHLKQDLEELSDIKVETVHDNGNWGFFRLIAEAKKDGDILKIDLPAGIKEALIKNDYYTTLDLMIIRELTGKYSVVLYEMAIRYKKVEIPELTIDEFKKLTGTENYKNFADIKRFCINPAITEINIKTDIIMTYETSSVGRKTNTIKFKLRLKDYEKIENLNYEKIFSDEVLKLYTILPEMEQIENRKLEIENLLNKHSFEYLLADIQYCKQKAKENFWAYFIKSVESGHFGKDDLQKAKKKKQIEIDKQQQKQINSDNEKELNDKIEYIVQNITKRDIDEFDEFYNDLIDTVKKVASKEQYLKTWLKDKYYKEND